MKMYICKYNSILSQHKLHRETIFLVLFFSFFHQMPFPDHSLIEALEQFTLMLAPACSQVSAL